MCSKTVGQSNFISEESYLKPRIVKNYLVSILLFACFVVALYCGFVTNQLPDFAAYTTSLLFLLSFAISVWVTPKFFTVGFLTSLLPFVIGWRIGAMTNVVPVMAISTIAFIIFVVQFFDCMRNDWSNYKVDGWFGNMQWQMTFIRIYFGFNEVGHCTEKLFAGQEWFNRLIAVFTHYGVPEPVTAVVILGGLCELALAIGIGCGLMTRLAGFCGVVYLLVANSYGGHFFNGYTWNARSSGGLGNGGWEYILLLLVFFGSFAFSGAGKFSLDRWLINRGLMPKFLLPFCLTKAGREQYCSEKDINKNTSRI